MTRTTTRLVGWLAVAFIAVAAATALILGTTGSRADVLSQDDVRDRLGRVSSDGGSFTPTSAAPSTSATAGQVGDATTVFQSAGGRVTLSCDGPTARLVSWSPNPGYRADDVTVGPAPLVSVWFESDTNADLLVKAACSPAGKAEPVVVVEADDHGGGSGKGGDGSGDDSGKSGSGGNSGKN
jgi:hypothetical protein